ncbi:MAG: endopeptidase La [Thermoanaerobaculia bacterium]|nr:endopeptidase La [Thermoanaerobaculia bacterium]
MQELAPEETTHHEAVPDVLPVLPLKDTVVFPYIILPLSVGREKSIQAVDRALSEGRHILMVPQRDPDLEEPDEDDLYRVGTASIIIRMLKLPDGRIRILVQGLKHVRIEHLSQTEPYLLAKVEDLPTPEVEQDHLEIEALMRSVKEGLERVVELGKHVSSEIMVIAANLDDPRRLADLVACNLELRVPEAQEILETVSPVERLRKVNRQLLHEIQLLTMQEEISSQARGEIDRNQREYYLRQQLKTIQTELGDSEELSEEIARYRRLAAEKGMPEEALTELERQIGRLERGHPDSAEASITRTYLETLTALPWSKRTDDDLELERARRVLDEDHYDLEPIKERILEYLAVRQLNPDTKGPILCFIGPPGVGKTSLGRSIARALGREFVRISLGGVHDEAEIRGHRRTYVGALPGRILQGIQQAGTSNPVFMLDEIDKLGADFRGDPSAALLEVLDPEQNATFRDHYLGVDYDLSRVMFITTGNLTEPIQPAFLDRMEVLRLSGYTTEEKLEIAKRHLIPRQVAENGLTKRSIRFTDAAVRKVISSYTRESGLRNLERELAALCRKVAVRVAQGREGQTVISKARVEKFLGPPKHLAEDLLDQDRVGVATGLAWTATGGDLLFIETVAVPGDGKLVLTGQLGEVMKESAQAALSFARSAGNGSAGHPSESSRDFFSRHDIHVHVPAGSIPKDGPSAGITIATAIVSLWLDRPADRKLAMSGEITLRGDVLPIGGLKEKVLAAREAGIGTLLLPRRNQRDAEELDEALTRGLEIDFVDHMNEVLERALKPARRARRDS